MPQLLTFSRTGVFREALGLGGSVGLLHAIAETTLLGLNGVRPSSLDLAIFAVIYCGAGLTLATLVALAALTTPLRAVLVPNDPAAFRRAVWTIIVIAYSLVFLRIMYFWSSGRSVLWLLAAAPALAIASVAVFRKGQRAIVPLCGSALIAATLCALQLVHANWDHDHASPWGFAIKLLIPCALCLAALLAATKATTPGRPFESIARGARALALLAAVWAGSWISLGADWPLGWFFDEPPLAANASRPNFLLIVLDTVRADHLDLFGYERETMPNLREFAQECQVAIRTPTAGAWTLPTHASIFTGLYPSAHGAHYPSVSDEDPEFLAYSLREDVPTLAEFLSSLGYQTAGIVANFAMLSRFGVSRGFQQFDASPGPAYFASRILWLYRVQIGGWPTAGEIIRDSLPTGLQGHSAMFSVRQPNFRRAREINAVAQPWLQRHGNRPFFLFLNYLDAHEPYVPIPEDDQRFVSRPSGKEWFGFPRDRYRASARANGSFTAEEIEFMRGQYDAELVSLDRELGRLFSYLKESGLFENTLILVTTDHGEAFFERGFPEHGNSVYQPEVDSLVLIKTPQSMSTIHASATMQGVDFLPTVAAVLNEPIPEHVQGSPWGNGRAYALSEVFCKSCGAEAVGTLPWPDALRHDQVAVTIGGRKLVRSTSGADEVYDLSNDPAERRPISEPDPEFLRQAEEVIAERNKRLVEGLLKHTGDEKLLEKLRSLGYVE